MATAIALGVVLVPALPAHAKADISVAPGRIDFPTTETTRNVSVKVTADQQGLVGGVVTINLRGQVTGAMKMSADGCQGSNTNATCPVAQIEPGKFKSIGVTLTLTNAGAVQPGQTLNGQLSVEGGNGIDGEGNVEISLSAPKATQTQAPTITEVSGTVKDSSTSTPIGGASVLLKAGDKEKRVSADSSGKFKFTGTAADPIPPGSVTLEAAKLNFKTATITRTGNANAAITGLALVLEAGNSSATPPPAVSEEPVPGDQGTGDSAAPDIAKSKAAADDGGTSMLSIVLIGMGILLVLLGVGAIIVLLRRNKEDQEPDDDFDGGPHDDRTRVGAVPGGRGAYHGGATDATRVSRGNMDDATAIVRPPQAPLDEFPDPYAAPAPTQVGGYPSQGGYPQGGGYNNNGYDDGGYGNRGGGGGGGGQYGDATRVGGYPQGGDGGYPQAGGNNYPPQGGQYGGGDYGQGGDRQYDGGYPPQGGGYEPPRAGGYDRGNYERPPQHGRQVNWMDD